MKPLVLIDDKNGYSIISRIITKNMQIDGDVRYCSINPISSKCSTTVEINRISQEISNAINNNLRTSNSTNIIVLIDFERLQKKLNICPGDISNKIINAISQKSFTKYVENISIVFKVQKLENWLLSDKEAVRSIISENIYNEKFNTLSLEKIDELNALKIIDTIWPNNKHHFAKRIVENLDPLRMAQNSRSFRRYLRVLGHPDYKDQSKDPAAL